MKKTTRTRIAKKMKKTRIVISENRYCFFKNF
jgi:hypothetical protein